MSKFIVRAPGVYCVANDVNEVQFTMDLNQLVNVRISGSFVEKTTFDCYKVDEEEMYHIDDFLYHAKSAFPALETVVFAGIHACKAKNIVWHSRPLYQHFVLKQLCRCPVYDARFTLYSNL